MTPGSDVSFVVMAGMYGQQPSGFAFDLAVNGVPRFTFVANPEENWEVTGREGGKLRFIAATRDKYGDLFGCLRITVPGTWLKPGEPVQFSLVGEKANQSAWCMVFEATDVVAYQRELVQNEAYCDMTIRTAGENSVVEFAGPSSWQGQRGAPRDRPGRGCHRALRWPGRLIQGGIHPQAGPGRRPSDCHAGKRSADAARFPLHQDARVDGVPPEAGVAYGTGC